VRLSEEEIKIAKRFQKKVELNGVAEVARWEFESGMNSENLIMKIFNWLKEQNWHMINDVIAADKAIIENAFKVEEKKEKKEITFNAALNRRISNAFDLSEIRRLGIKHMAPEEALSLVEARENERRVRQ